MDNSMDFIIRNMTEQDTQEVMDMMRVFYASPAVQSNGSDEVRIWKVIFLKRKDRFWAMQWRQKAFRQNLESHVYGLKICT